MLMLLVCCMLLVSMLGRLIWLLLSLVVSVVSRLCIRFGSIVTCIVGVIRCWRLIV